MNDRELAKLLRETALLEGEFTLRSGRKSRYYLDKYLFETQPGVLRELAKRFATHVTQRTARIAGAELGAVALAAATALETDKPFVIVRNSRKADYGTGKLIEGRLERGEAVLLVEDIATSGGQAIEAARVLREAGADVERIVAVIDRQEGARAAIEAAGLQFSSLFTSADLGIVKSCTRGATDIPGPVIQSEPRA
ncbi:Orotate phosphoribosyltransferase [Phycisphaerae bacterium RAS1]|nr:Orotate phosphoribosyltransferase [Phycisphaerae bacterium RAS1]